MSASHLPDLPKPAIDRPRIGIVGCGNWARDGYLPHCLEASLRVVALCDLDTDHLAACAQVCTANGHDPALFSGPSAHLKMLDEIDLDAVMVLVPPAARSPILLDVMRQRLSCFLEKPLCAKRAEARSLIKAYISCGEYDIPGRLPITCTGLGGRAPAMAEIQRWIRDGTFGVLRAAHISYSWRWDFQDLGSWRSQSCSGGGHIKEKLIHVLDAVDWVFGPFREVRGCGIPLASNPADWSELSACFSPADEGKSAVHLACSFGTRERDHLGLDLVFQRRSVQVTLQGDRFIARDDRSKTWNLGNDEQWWPSRKLEEFVAALEGRGLCSTTLLDAYVSFMLADALEKAVFRRSPQEIPHYPTL